MARQVNSENEEQIPCSSPERRGRTRSQDASGHIGMEASTEQSAQSIHSAKLALGTAPDAQVSREAQGKLPLTGTIAPSTLHTVPD